LERAGSLKAVICHHRTMNDGLLEVVVVVVGLWVDCDVPRRCAVDQAPAEKAIKMGMISLFFLNFGGK
jgi:hypothetical protein